MSEHNQEYQDVLFKYMQRCYFRNIDKCKLFYVKDILEFYKEYMEFHQIPFLCLAVQDLCVWGSDSLYESSNNIGFQMLKFLYGRDQFSTEESDEMESIGISAFLTHDEYMKFLRIGLVEMGKGADFFDEYIEKMKLLSSSRNHDVTYSAVSQYVRIGMMREIIDRNNLAYFTIN